MPDQYAVVGNPIAHSKSPHIHRLFAGQTGQDMEYRAILVEVDGFADAMDRFRAAGGKGLNITLPFKQDAYRYATQLSERAKRAGAVNTLRFDGGQAFGDNTDGAGLVRDLGHNIGLVLAGRNVLLLGAGGAARGVLQPLLRESPSLLWIANRTSTKAAELAREFQDLGPVQGSGLEVLAGHAFDLIINATSTGLTDDLPPLPDQLLRSGGACYDMVYGSEPTAFVRWGWAQGAAKSVDGLGMLVEQAAESFFIWRGVRPDTAPVLEDLRPS